MCSELAFLPPYMRSQPPSSEWAPQGLPPILTQMSPRERGARWHHYRRPARAQSPSLTAAFPSLRRGQDGSAPHLKEWTEAQRDEVARPGSTCVRWQRGDGNAACHVPALLSLYLWKFRCQALTPTFKVKLMDTTGPELGGWGREAMGLWAQGAGRPGLSSPSWFLWRWLQASQSPP